MKKILLITIVILSTSCQGQHNILKVEECIQKKFNTTEFLNSDLEKVNFFEMILSIEKELINTGFLNDNSRDSYLKADINFHSLDRSSLKNKLDKILEDNNVYDLGTVNNLIYNCINYYNNDLGVISDSMENQMKVYDKVYAEEGVFNSENFNKLVLAINNEDFNNIICRSALIILIYDSLGSDKK